MKNFTSFIAVFLMCFGITVQAQTIETIGSNITDPATELTNGSYVILKNVSAQKCLYAEPATPFAIMAGDSAVTGAGTLYLWQVHVQGGQYWFTTMDGRFFPRPKTTAESKSGFICTGNLGGYKGVFTLAPHADADGTWTMQCKWKEGGKKNHDKFWSIDGDKFSGIDVASKDEPSTKYEIIPVTIAKTQEQLDIEALVKTWQGKERYAGGIPDKTLQEALKCKTLAEAEAKLAAAIKNPLDDTEYFQILNTKVDTAMDVRGGELSVGSPNSYNVNVFWKLTKTAEGKYTLMHANSNGYVQEPGTLNVGDAAMELDVTSLDTAAWSISVNGKYLTWGAEGFGVADNAAAEGAQWYLAPKKDLRIVLNPVYAEDGVTVLRAWGAFHFPFNATCGNSAAGIVYYGVKGANATAASMQKTDGIQANKGILLYHEGEQTEFGFKIGKNAKNTEDQTWNVLQGTNVDIPAVAGSYVLKSGAQGEGLYRLPAEAKMMWANTSYLVDESAAGDFLQLVEGDITGIGAVETATENAVFYDLSGRRVAHPVHGVYINNGKKVFVK